MKKMIYGITNNENQLINGVKIDKYIDRSKLMSLIDLSEPKEVDIIVSDITVLGDSLNEIVNVLNTIHDKGIGFKSIEDNVNSHNEKTFTLFISHINKCNDIVFKELEEKARKIRIGGKKRGKRETFEFPKDWEENYKQVIRGNITKTKLAEHYGITRQSIYDWFDRYEKQNGLGKYKDKQF